MQIPLVVALWEHPGFAGRKRLFVENAPNLANNAFDDKVSAIGVHPGPDYAAWKTAHGGQEPTVGFYENPNYGGALIILTMGQYPNIETVYNFNDKISSIKFQAVHPVAGTISPIKLVVEIYADANYTGNRLIVVENSANITAQFGSEFNDVTTSVIVKQGPNYATGNKAQLYRDPNYMGGMIELAPGSYPNIGTSFGFNDVISSIKVL